MSSSYFRRTVLYRRPNLTPEKKIVMILKTTTTVSPSSHTFSNLSPVTNEEDCDGGEECVPPPQHEVDLLVDDVLGEDAEPVVHLLAAARAHIGDVTGGHGGEH